MIDSCAEKTYATTTIGDVVAGARVSRTTFYRNFEDKRACFDAALDESIAATWEAADDAIRSSGGEPARAIREAVAAVLELLAERPQLAHLMVGEAVAVEPAVVRRYRDLVVPAVSSLWTEEDAAEASLDPWLAFGRAQLLIFDRVTAGEAERLPDLLPELLYLAVAPFAGHDAAIAEARACREPVGGPVR